MTGIVVGLGGSAAHAQSLKALIKKGCSYECVVIINAI